MRKATLAPVSLEQVDDEEVKWVSHYSSVHDILLVGEGDFSFSHSLATTFGSAFNMVATSLDTYEALIAKYKNAKSNVESLKTMGATILHGIDATKMKLRTDLMMRKFDRIIFNFPHAGFKGKEDSVRLINVHKQLVCGFFKNASRMLRPYGEVHVSHKTGIPFCHWNLKELASKNFLVLVDKVKFKIEDYPGYHNKRGDGRMCDKPFPLGECCTFKFRIGNNTSSIKQTVISTSFVNTATSSINMSNFNTDRRYLLYDNIGQLSSFSNADVNGPSGSFCSPAARHDNTWTGSNFGPPVPYRYPGFSSRSFASGTYVPGRSFASGHGYLLQYEESHLLGILRKARMERILHGLTPSLQGGVGVGVGTLYHHADRYLPF